jgi:hypothetical protein
MDKLVYRWRLTFLPGLRYLGLILLYFFLFSLLPY